MKELGFSLLMLILAFATYAGSNGKCGENLYWTLSDNGLLSITGLGEMKDFGSRAAPWNPVLVKQLSLEEGITHIGDNAFCNTKIYSVIIPTTVITIGKNAFSNCKNLTTIQLPYGLTDIGAEAFKNCKTLVKLDLPASLKRIEKKAFNNCMMLNSLTLSNRIEIIGENVFGGCKSLNHFYSLPDIVTPTNCLLYGLSPSVVADYYKSTNDIKSDMRDSHQNSSIAQIETNSITDVQKNNSINAGVNYGESDIDKSLPHKPQNNNHTFAFIFANENYNSFPDVPFAINDGKSFHNYCSKVMGIPEENITTRYNATLGTILQTMDYMNQIDNAFKGDISIIIYYAGHGAPDEKTSKAYLVPSDAYSLNDKACYSLDNFYQELGRLKANSVKVFMDACFSGTGRTEEMLAKGGRSVKAVPKKASVTGNVVVISATASDQTAWHYKQQGHGLFTYCLLKKLKQTGGEASMGELCDYLESEVPKISIVANRITQTPTSQHSPNLGNSWKLWQVKK